MIKNAAIYISDPAMLGSRLFDRSPDILSYETFEKEGGENGFKLNLKWGEITCNIMPETDLENHLSGFEGYMKEKIDNEKDLIYFLSRLYYVNACLGLEITHKKNTENDVYNFLFSMNEVLSGLLYMHDTVWDWSREALGGALKN